jgi:hypothetical protein
MDLRDTITPNSNQLNADDLISGPKTIRIRDVKATDSDAQPVSIYFDSDDNKPYKPSKGMRRVLVALWGANAKDYIGRYLTLYRDDKVKFGGIEVGGIRISHASHINEPTRVLETVGRGKRRPITIEVLKTPKKELKDINGAKEAIEKGTHTFEQINAAYDLTEEQIKILKG